MKTIEKNEKNEMKTVRLQSGITVKDIALRNFNSIGTRKAKKGDLDIFGKQIPKGEPIFVVLKQGYKLSELPAMPLSYEWQKIKGPDGKTIKKIRVGYKEPKIRTSYKGKKQLTDGKCVKKYLQHTAIIEGEVAYWYTGVNKK